MKSSIDYHEISRRFPFLHEPGQALIVSPDADGVLCALTLLGHHRHKGGSWVVGFFNAETLVTVPDCPPLSSCVFLDIEIYRPGFRSVGQHLPVAGAAVPATCLNPCVEWNRYASHPVKDSIKLKYPFSTALLVAAVVKANVRDYRPYRYADGTEMCLARYPHNCKQWSDFLRLEERLPGVWENTSPNQLSHPKGRWKPLHRRCYTHVGNERSE